MLLDCISMGQKAKHHVLGHDARTWLRSCVGDDLNLVRANIFPVRHLNLATKYKRYIFIVFSWTGILIVYQEVKLGIFSRKQQREHLWYGINGLRSLFFFLFLFVAVVVFFLQSISLIFTLVRVPSEESVLMKEPEKRAVESPVPSHWSYTPASEPYTRVMLDSSSWEFKKVEQLFIASMSNMVIKKIDRVQNPFMWEKYRR